MIASGPAPSLVLPVTASEDDWILLFGTGVLAERARRVLYRDGWAVNVVGSEGTLAMWWARKVSDGTETDVPVAWETGANRQEVALTATLADAIDNTDEATTFSDAGDPVGFEDVTALGAATVYLVAATAFGDSSIVAPTGYVLVDEDDPTGSPYGTLKVWSDTVPAGVVTPPDSVDSAASWLTMTVLIHDQAANILATGYSDSVALPMSAVDFDQTPPVPDATVDDVDLAPVPPTPTALDLPAPPWLAEGQHRPPADG